MCDTHANDTCSREPAARSGDRFDVTLLWHRETGELSVVVHDTRIGAWWQVAVGDANPLDVYRHPLVYASVSPSSVRPHARGGDTR